MASINQEEGIDNSISFYNDQKPDISLSSSLAKDGFEKPKQT